jgi:hypothetical protein
MSLAASNPHRAAACQPQNHLEIHSDSEPGLDTAIPEHIKILQKLSSVPRSPNSAVSLWGMMAKNFTQKVRTPVGTFLETLLPFIFVCGLVLIWAATSDGNKPTTQYTNQTGNITTVPDAVTPLSTILCASPNVTINSIRNCLPSELAEAYCPDQLLAPRMPVRGLCVIGGGVDQVIDFAGFARVRDVPALDEIIQWGWIARMVISDDTRGQQYNSRPAHRP